MKRGYRGTGVGVDGPKPPYRVSICLRISGNGVPALCIFITSRVMSMQSVQVAAWLVNVTRSAVSVLT